MGARHVLGDHAADAAQRLAPSLSARRAAARTSSSVIRPPGPVPVTAARSTPSSCAIRRTTGVACTLSTRSRRRCGSSRSVSLRRRDDSVEALAGCADDDELSSDRRDLALGDEDLQHRSAVRRRDLDGRLVGLDLDERVVLGDLLPLRDEPAGDLALGETLAEVGKLERARHRQP